MKKSVKIKLIFSFLMIWTCLSVLSALVYAQADYPIYIKLIEGTEQRYPGGQVLVKFNNIYSESEILDKMRSYDIAKVKKLLSGEWVFMLFTDKAIDPLDICDDMEKKSDIIIAMPNFLLQAADQPNDEFYRNLTDTTQSSSYPNQWGFFKMNTAQAWNITTGSFGIKLGILDTGIDIDHPDFDFNSGRFSYMDLVNQGGNANDTHGHGTHMAGIITSRWNSGSGSMFAGMVKNNQILIMKQSNDLDWTVDKFLDGVTQAVAQGVRILNYSGGTPSPTQYQLDCFEDAVAYADNNNLIVVASAGNNHGETGPKAKPYINIPGAFQDQYSIICVGSTSFSDKVASKSSRDPNPDKYPNAKVTLAAPGYKYWSTYKNGSYDYTTGTSTSAAAAMTTGLAGLVLSIQSNLTDDEVKFVLKATADKVGGYSYSATEGWTKNIGHGRINARWALESLIPPYYDDCGNPWDSVQKKPMEPHRYQGIDEIFYPTPEKTVSKHSTEVIYKYFGLTGTNQQGMPVNYKIRVTYYYSPPVKTSLYPIQDLYIDEMLIDNNRTVTPTPQEYTFNIPNSAWQADHKIIVKFKKEDGPAAMVSEIEILEGPLDKGSMPKIQPDEMTTSEIPQDYLFLKNYPNPFNATTKIIYRLQNPCCVSLKIYNMRGEVVSTLINADQKAQQYQINWDGKNDSGQQVAAGIYICRLQSGKYTRSIRLVLLR